MRYYAGFSQIRSHFGTINFRIIEKTLAVNSNVSRHAQLLKECKISFHMYVDKDSKALKWWGPEKLKVFHKIEIAAVSPGVPNATLAQKIWKDFLTIYNTLCLNPFNRNQIKDFQVAVRKWLSLFLSVYQNRYHSIHAYTHFLCSRVLEPLWIFTAILTARTRKVKRQLSEESLVFGLTLIRFRESKISQHSVVYSFHGLLWSSFHRVNFQGIEENYRIV